jgi:tetratricopeptide (TPR) repeat protein
VLLALGTLLALAVAWGGQRLRQTPRNPAQAMAHVQAAQAFTDSGEFAAAASECRVALANDPENSDASLILGHALYRLQRYPEARTALEKALAAKPDDGFALCYLGLAYAQQPGNAEDERRAQQLLERATQSYDAADPWYGLGLLALRQNRIEEAIHRFRKAVAVDPGWETGHYRLAEAYRIAGDETQAAREARAFARLKDSRPEYGRLLREVAGSPGPGEPLLRLARLCLETGRYREALDHYQELSRGAPSAAVFEGLAKAADALGQTEVAAQARRAARAGGAPR